MDQDINRQVLLKSRPADIPQAEDFEIVEAPVPQPGDNEVLVRNIYLSVEPAMRGWVSAVANYSEPVGLGTVMRAFTVGRVAASGHSDFQTGEIVTGMFGWQDYALVEAQAIQRKVTATDLPISTSLGVLGLNGITAYFGLLEIGQPKAGETVVKISANVLSASPRKNSFNLTCEIMRFNKWKCPNISGKPKAAIMNKPVRGT